MRKFGKKGSGIRELKWPTSVSIDSNDTVYVADKDNHQVSIFTLYDYLEPREQNQESSMGLME